MERNKKLFILASVVLTSLLCLFSTGICGNDFWWHVKAGEWMIKNRSLPTIDVFSWYAKANEIEWLSHEWLSQIIFYLIHHITGEIGILILSLGAACLMVLMIIYRNRQYISNNIILTGIFFLPLIILLKSMFYGRPHLFSFFLIYATLACLYKYQKNESRSIFLVPLIALLWGNIHGGSSTLSYILCFLFFASSLFQTSFGKLSFEKLSARKSLTFLGVALASLFALAINPYGIEMLAYPYSNMGDSFMQKMISEWGSPDAKNNWQLFTHFFPFAFVTLCFIMTEKKIKSIDLFIYLFFSYMLFRSVRFGIVFYIATTFFVFNYFPERVSSSIKGEKYFRYMITCCVVFLSILAFRNTLINIRQGNIISTVLNTRFIELIKMESPKRLYNDYNFGVTLIYNNIETFVDARADLFSPHNLRDALNLANLQDKSIVKNSYFDPDSIIEKYQFDAFLVDSKTSLAAYLKSKPDKYKVLLEDDEAVYLRTLLN